MIQIYLSAVHKYRMFVVAAVSAAVLLFAGMFLYQAHAESTVYPPAGNTVSDSSVRGYLSDKVYLGSGVSGGAVEAVAPAVPETKKAAIVEIHIANSGLVLLRGARVASIRSGTIRLNLILGASNFTWTAETSTYTKFLTSGGEKKTLADIKAGDIVTVTGKLKTDSAPNTVDADFVRG